MPRPRKATPPIEDTPDGPGTLTIEAGKAEKLPPIPDDEPEPEPKPSRARSTSGGRANATKVSAEDVTTLTVATFGMIAQVRQREYWKVSPDECREWAGHAAALINNMPKSVSKRIAGGTSAGAVLIGLGGILYARVQIDAAVNAQLANAHAPASYQPTPDMTNGNGPLNPADLFTYSPNGLG